MLNTKNNVYIVGELVEIKDFKNDVWTDNNGDHKYVAATVVVKSIVNDQELLTEARAFINELTKNGTVNKNYTTLKDVDSLLNKRVVISGARLVSERFWSTRTSQLSNSTRINFNLIRAARSTETDDKVTFEFGGFVTRPIQEVLDENGEVKHYQISIGQATYSENDMFEVNFIVDKDNLKAVQVMGEQYTSGATVEVSGVCKTIVSKYSKQTEIAFGEPIVKEYINTDKKFVITGGSEVLSGEGEYTDEVINNLVAVYSAKAKEIQAKATSAEKTSASPAAKPKPKNTNLAGLI
jgi:hypothetical protein